MAAVVDTVLRPDVKLSIDAWFCSGSVLCVHVWVRCTRCMVMSRRELSGVMVRFVCVQCPVVCGQNRVSLLFFWTISHQCLFVWFLYCISRRSVCRVIFLCGCLHVRLFNDGSTILLYFLIDTEVRYFIYIKINGLP
jgi:hypothetical protein